MTDDRTLERAARSWLEEGPTRAPDRPVEAALARIQMTRQERDLVPWRLSTMNSNARLVASLAAIAVVVAVGIYVLRPPSNVGPPAAPTPSPTSLTITTSDVGNALQPGTYRVHGFAAPFSVTLPAGWTASAFARNSIALESRSEGSINVALIVMDKVYPDPCHTATGKRVTAPGVDALVNAFSSMPDFDVTDISDATVGGANGKSFTISNSIDVAADKCSEDMLFLGTYDKDGKDVDVTMFGGETDLFWVVNANGTRVLIAITNTPRIVQEAQPVLDSVSFGDGSSS
jgi:hypothetical protein